MAQDASRFIGLIPDALVADARIALEPPLPANQLRLNHVMFPGNRWSVGLASELALKLRESAGAWTEAYPVWEYRVAPISCAGPDSLVWARTDPPEVVAAYTRSTGSTTYTDDPDPQANLVLAHRLTLS